MNLRLTKLVFVFLIALWINPISAQQDNTTLELSNPIDKATYEEVKKQLDLTKTKKALRPKEVEPKKDKEAKEKKRKEDTLKPGSSLSAFQNLGIFKILSYLLIIGLVSLLVYYIFSNIELDKKFELSKENISIDDLEDIQTLDTDNLLKDALAKGDFRTAVRIKFLAVLKDLSQREKIKWKREKTNRTYSQELNSESYGGEFKELTYIFDNVWYGKQQLLSTQYDQIDRQFISFTNLMNE